MSLTLSRFVNWHDACANKTTILIMAAIYPIFPVVLLPWIGDVGGAPILDLHLTYNADVVRQVLAQYDASAIANYKLCALTVDMVYPVYYALLLSLVIAWLMNRGQGSGKSSLDFRFLPFVVMIVDWSENLMLVSLVESWPAIDQTLANTAGMVTLSKWLLLAFVLVIMIVHVAKLKRCEDS